MPDLLTIRTKAGVPFTVAREHASAFQNLLDELEAGGYEIKPDQSGGYNPRVIFGTNKLSEHAHGKAIDINWMDNPRGKAGTIQPETARALAAKYGLEWGGDWSNPDPMHFQIANRAATPLPMVATTGVDATSQAVPGAQSAPTLAMVPPPAGTASTSQFALSPEEEQKIRSMLGDSQQQPVGDPQTKLATDMLAALDAEAVPSILQMVPRRTARRMSYGRMRA